MCNQSKFISMYIAQWKYFAWPGNLSIPGLVFQWDIARDYINNSGKLKNTLKEHKEEIFGIQLSEILCGCFPEVTGYRT